MNADAQENLIAIRVVKAFVREDYEIDKFNRSAEAVKQAQKRAERLLVISSPLMQITMYACIIAVIWLGGGHVIDGQLAAGDLMSFIAYISQILMSLMMITMAFVNFVLSSASAKRIYEVLTEVPVIKDGPESADVVPADGSIEFRDVCFSYSDDPNNLVLSHINLSIRSGEVIGIIGGSGSSKTTLVQLIPRLYDVLSGEVIVGAATCATIRLNRCAATSAWCCKRTCSSPARSATTCAGATRTPRRSRSRRPAAPRPRTTSS